MAACSGKWLLEQCSATIWVIVRLIEFLIGPPFARVISCSLLSFHAVPVIIGYFIPGCNIIVAIKWPGGRQSIAAAFWNVMGGTYDLTGWYSFQDMARHSGDLAKILMILSISRKISCCRKNCCKVWESLPVSNNKYIHKLNRITMLRVRFLGGRSATYPYCKTYS